VAGLDLRIWTIGRVQMTEISRGRNRFWGGQERIKNYVGGV